MITIAISVLIIWSVFGPALRRYDGGGRALPSDGCTIAGTLYGWFGDAPPWRDHCIHVHDPAYAKGGSWWHRIVADWHLARVIWRCGDWHRLEAAAVFVGLLCLGGLPWPWRHYRWGGATTALLTV